MKEIDKLKEQVQRLRRLLSDAVPIIRDDSANEMTGQYDEDTEAWLAEARKEVGDERL